MQNCHGRYKFLSALPRPPAGPHAFETITLVQCQKLVRFPIVAMGSEFWEQMRVFVRGALINEKTISPGDLDLLHVTDSPEEALTYIQSGVAQTVPSLSGID